MALTNIPEMSNTENNVGITSPSPLPEQPCGACFPSPRKPMFTVQEEFIETRHRVNETLARVLNLQKHIETTLNSLSSSLSADNETFKNLTINTYNDFSKTVVDEVNSFEASITNAFKVLDESLNSSITDSILVQNKKINEAYAYLKTNLDDNVVESINELYENGTLENIINNEVFATKITKAGAEALVNEAVAELEAKIEFNTNSINNAHNRISGLSSLSQGSTTGDAELIDMRRAVTGNYGSAGDALRGEITAVLNRITAIEGSKRILKGYGAISAEEESATMKDVDFFPPNSVVSIAYPESCTFMLNMPEADFIGTIVTFSQTGLNDGGSVQLALNLNNRRLYTRIRWGAENKWLTWQKLATQSQIDDVQEWLDIYTNQADLISNEVLTLKNKDVNGYISCFPVIGCIGDSLASGESIYTAEDGSIGYADLYEHSWGQHMARSAGIKVHNFSVGGFTTRSWFGHSRGLEMAEAEGNECHAYIIALGVNDRNNLGSDYLGTKADINADDCTKNADTYYGNYAKIIQKMKAVQPKAKFFLMTDPKQSVTEAFNWAVKEIAEMFTNCYLLDMTKYASMFKSTGAIGKHERKGHYNTVAYKKMSNIIAEEISNIIGLNPTEFAQVEFIGTDFEY